VNYRSDGTFVISDVPPGEYYVTAMVNRRDGGPNAPREGAYVPVSVNGDEVSVSIQTNLGATVAGRVVFEGTPPPPQAGGPGGSARPAPVRVMPTQGSNAYLPSAGTQASATVRPDGTFELTGLRGSVQFTVMSGHGALKSVSCGGRDISGQPLELQGTERIDDLVFTMTEEIGTIDAEVTDEHGDPVDGAPFVVFQDDPGRWGYNSPFVRSGSTATAQQSLAATIAVMAAGTAGAGQAGARTPPSPGRFTLRNLPRGRYAVVALPPDTQFVRPDREMLQHLREVATTVTVDGGQTATVQLKPIK
jgi:hypothetical protein